MDRYVAVIHKDGDSAYGAYFPDLIGCFAAGDTEDVALNNLRISLRIYVEDLIEHGKKLPRARSAHELLKDPEVKEALADPGAVLVMVPLLFAEKKRRINITLEPSLIAALDKAAKIAGTNRSDYLASAAWRLLKAETGAVRVRKKVSKRGVRKAAKRSKPRVRQYA